MSPNEAVMVLKMARASQPTLLVDYNDALDLAISALQSDVGGLVGGEGSSSQAKTNSLSVDAEDAPSGWRTIDSAPEGKDILVSLTHCLGGDEWETIQWVDWQVEGDHWPIYGERIDIPFPPTHWRPLPTPPELASSPSADSEEIRDEQKLLISQELIGDEVREIRAIVDELLEHSATEAIAALTPEQRNDLYTGQAAIRHFVKDGATCWEIVNWRDMVRDIGGEDG